VRSLTISRSSPILAAILAACGGSAPQEPAKAFAPDGSTADVAGIALREPEIAERIARLDPRSDGWETEAVHEILAKRLEELAAALARSGSADLSEFATRDCRVEAQSEWRPAGEGGAFVVTRASGPTSAREARGAAGLAGGFRDLLALVPAAPSRRVDTKIVGIETSPGAATTRVLLHASGESPAIAAQVNALLRCEWAFSEGPPRIRSLAIEEAEAVRGGGRFEDRTAAVLGALPSFREQLLPGVDHWAARIPAHLGVSILGHEGLAIGDVDGDGQDDLYVCQPGGLPNRLYVRRPDGTAEDRSREAGVDFLDAGRSALLVDLDGDADADLAVVAGASLLLLENDGTGRFSVRAALPALAASSLAAADVEGDGDLDLYACSYWAPDARDRTPFPYHDANNGSPNTLFRNEGSFRFADATAETGLDENNRRFSLAAAFEDFDDDGDPDLYVANDYGRNNLYRNEGGRFRDVAAEAGVEDVAAGMGVAWADVDGDGAMDLHVSNMFSSAGSRVTTQARFKPEADEATRALYRRHARGNSLFRNLGGGRFADASVEAGITAARWAWGCVFADFDRDGREDLFVANGYVTNEDPHDL